MPLQDATAPTGCHCRMPLHQQDATAGCHCTNRMPLQDATAPTGCHAFFHSFPEAINLLNHSDTQTSINTDSKIFHGSALLHTCPLSSKPNVLKWRKTRWISSPRPIRTSPRPIRTLPRPIRTYLHLVRFITLFNKEMETAMTWE